MADKKRKIDIGIGFNVDRTGLNDIKTSLQQLQNMSLDDLVKINGASATVDDLKKIQGAATAVQDALEKSFNTKLNTQDLTKFNAELKASGYTLETLKAELMSAGPVGASTFRNITTELLTTNRYLRETSGWLDKMAETMGNTIRWSIASTALNSMTGAVQKAYSFTKQLDTALNDIRIVTGKSADQMADFAIEANNAAKNLGSTTKEYVKAALIYEQQGLGAADVEARSTVTTKVANVTGQSANEVSEQLTAIWNGYKVQAAEAELYIDKVSAVAATTAADLQELSEGMGKVASAANSMGVDMDQLNAALATIISVTRQDASSVGTALKTIFARMGDLAVDGEDEFGVKLGDVSGKLAQMGVQVLDSQGQMREMGAIIEEVAAKWETWTRAQQQAAAVALAGKRQYNNLIALFENWDMYESAKATSQSSAGELQKQQDIYMDSMEAHLNQLQAEAEELYSTLLDPEGLNPLIDVLTAIVGLVENVIQSLGGGAGLLTTLGAIGLNVFDKQITKGITSVIHNVSGLKDNLKQAAAEARIVKELELTDPADAGQAKILDVAKERLKVAESMSEEEYLATNEILKQVNGTYKQQDALKEQRKTLEEISRLYTGTGLTINETTGEIENAKEAVDALGNKLSDVEIAKKHSATAIDEAAAGFNAAAIVEAKQRSVASRKGVVTRVANEGADIAQELALQQSGGGQDQETIDSLQQRQTENTQKQKEKMDELSRATQQLAEAEAKLNQEKSKSNAAIKEVVVALAKEQNNEDASLETKAKLAQLSETIGKAFTEEGKLRTKNKKTIEEAVAALREYNGILDEQEKTIKKSKKELADFNDKQEDNNQAVDEADEKLKKLKNSFKLTEAVQNVTDLAGGIANVASGISTLQNLGSIWDDEDLTTGEKLLQTITALSFGLPMLVNGFATMRTSLTALLAPLAAKTTLTALDSLATSQNTDKQQENALWSKALELAKDGLTKEEYEAALAAMAEGKAINANTKEKIKSILGDQAKVLSLKTLANAARTAAKAIGTATVAFFSSPIGWIVLAVTAAIAAIAAMIHLISAYTVTEEEAYNNAKQRQEELAQSLEETKNAYEELKSSIEDYKSARDGLEELTVGTTEWKEALAEANSQALQLLQTYPELAKYITKDAQGLITISDEGMQALADQQLDEVYKAQTAYLIGNSVLRDAQMAYNQTQDADTYGIQEDQLDAILKLSEETILNPDEFSSALKNNDDINIQDDELIDSLFENRESLVALKATVDQTNSILAIEGGEILGNFLKQYGYSEQDAGVLGGIISSNMNPDANMKTDIEALKQKIAIGDSAFTAWANAMNIEADKGSFENDSWNAQIKYRVDGEEKIISYDQFKEELATWQYYFQGQSKYLETAKNLLNKIGDTTTRETNNIIRSVFASNRAITKDQIEDFNIETLTEIQKVLDSETELLTDGQESILKQTKANLDNSLKNMGKERGWFDLNPEDTISPIQDALVTVFKTTDWTALIDSGVNYSALGGVGDVLSRIRVMEGEAGLQNTIAFLNKFEDPAAFIESIDWTSETLGADIGGKMRELGMEVDFTDEVTAKAIMHFTQLTDALETTAERAANTKKIIDGLEYGDSISKEDYAYLQTNYGSLIDGYFSQLEDGTAVLTASAWDFYEAYHKLDIEKRKAKAQELKETVSQLSTFQDDARARVNTFTTSIQTISHEKDRDAWVNNLASQRGVTISAGAAGLALYNEQGIANNEIIRINPDGTYYDDDKQDFDKTIAYADYAYRDIYKEWFSTDKGQPVWKRIAKNYGVDSVNDLTDEQWGDIIQDQLWEHDGPNQIKVDTNPFLGGVETYSVKQIWYDIAYSRANKIHPDENYSAYNKEEINTFIQDLVTKGVIDQTAYDTYLASIIDDDNSYRLQGESAPIITAIQDAIDATEGSADALQQELVGLLANAKDETEFNILEQYITDTYGDILDSETIKQITQQGQRQAKVSFDKTAIDRYNKAIDNLTNSYERLGKEISQLETLMEMTTGEKRLEYLDQINEKILEQNKLLAAQEKYSRSEIRRQLTFGTNTTNDTDGIADNTQVESALKRLMVAYRFATEDKVEAMTLETIFKRLGLNYQGTLTEELYNQLLTVLLGKNANLSGDQQGAATEATNTIITVLGTVFDTISENAQTEIDNFMTLLANNLDKIDLRLNITLETKEAQNEYENFLRTLYKDNTELIAQTYLQDFAAATVSFKDIQDELQNVINQGAFIDTESRTLWDKYKAYGRISKEQYEALSAEDKARVGAWGLTETTWHDPGTIYIAGMRTALDARDVEGYSFSTDINDYLTAADKQSKITELISSLMEQGLDAQDILNAYADNIIAYHDKVNEAYDKYVEYIDSANSALEHQKTLYELIYGDEAIDDLDSYYNAQANNAKMILDMRKQQYQQDELDYTNMLENEANYTEEMRESITSQYLASAENYFSSLNDLATKYQEEYIHNVEKTMRKFEQDLFGAELSKMKEQFDWLLSVEEDSLNELEAAFAKSSVDANFTKAIAATTDLKAQQRINDLREEELKLLNEKTNLTQYDIDRANKRLEILQAEIDLQNALNNTTQMRLVRGADGSYGYQYVANLDDVTERTEKLNNAQKELVQLDEDTLQSSLNKAYDLYEEWYDKVIEMMQNGAAWDEINTMTEGYVQRFETIGGAISTVIGALQDSANDANNLLSTNFSFEEVFPQFSGEFAKAIADKFSSAMTGAIEQLKNDDNGLQGLWSNYQKIMVGTDEEPGLLRQLNSATSAYVTSLTGDNGLVSAQSNVILSLEGMKGAMKEATDAINDMKNALATWAENITTTVDENDYADTKLAFTITQDNETGVWKIVQAATGMYTGEWGPEGKLAILHEKELVLNKADTANILSAVNVARAIAAQVFANSRFGSALKSPQLDANAQNTGEKKVQIEAHFPNATDKESIKAAFSEMLQEAEQILYESPR